MSQILVRALRASRIQRLAVVSTRRVDAEDVTLVPSNKLSLSLSLSRCEAFVYVYVISRAQISLTYAAYAKGARCVAGSKATVAARRAKLQEAT